MGLDDVHEKTGFWILGGGGTAMVLIGWIMSRRWEMETLPFWQMLIIIAAIWIAAALFAAPD